MSYKTDLHLHTYFSDGSMSPTDIVKRAKEMGYELISITDHDGVDGIPEATIAGKALGIKVIPGIELSTEDEQRISMHILGYDIDIDNPELLDKLKELKQKRKDRNDQLIEVLNKMGYAISMEDLRFTEGQSYIGKPIIARALLKKGYITDAKQAFESGKFLESPEAKAVKKDKISAEEAITLIKKAGGIAVLAHPMKIKKIGDRGTDQFYEELEKLIQKMKAFGLKGIECYHTDQTNQESLRLVELAEKYHLHITEGSDYHGPEFEKPHA
ncbi:PHP domain-containing protein [Clostridium aminobutyricum]|uniref:PHP domain-containing protein n=1 Tax=Clostridium aminobutyricum TaxID=33953 RepID=A0A939D9T9_CLOAM|nr:PHP domain-containing protein [Clostridium aminobutyricum]MBN7773707.1 PHP domain-containing protein [Clostridium aminobutyricum]